MFVFGEVSTCFGLPIEIGRTHLTRCIEFFSDSFSEVLLLFRRAAAAAAAAATSAAAAETSSEYFDFCSAFFRFETKAEFFFKQKNKAAPFFFVARRSGSSFSTKKSVLYVAKISSSIFCYKKFKPFQEKCKIFYRSVTRKCFELELCCNRRLP